MNYLASKIRATIDKGVEYFTYNKNDPYECIRLMENIGTSKYIFVSESSDDYLCGKRSIKIKFIILILQLCIWATAFKCLLIWYYNDRAISIMIGDFSYVIPRYDIFNAIASLLLTGVAISGKHSLSIETYFLFNNK